MRQRGIWNGFDLINAQYPQGGLPPVMLENGILVGADPGRWRSTSQYLVQQPACDDSFDVAGMSSKADYTPGIDIGSKHDPVGSEMPECRTKRFAPGLGEPRRTFPSPAYDDEQLPQD